VELNELFSGSKFFEYAGSLSAPPCAEIATWLVRQKPVTGPEAQVRALYDAVLAASGGYGNFRSTMPLNGRTVALREAMAEDAPLTAPPDVSIPSSASTLAEGREARAEQWAKDALKIARTSADYARDLDRRVHSIAEAHEHILAPLPTSQEVPQPGPQGGSPNASAVSRPSGSHAPGQAPHIPSIESLSQAVEVAAKEAVADAVKQISAETRAAALQAAQDAARAVVQDIAMGRFPVQPAGLPPS